MQTEFDEQLELIREKCLNCEKCSLCKTRTNSVFSAGVPNSKLMLIGEAPGYYEDMKGEPFENNSSISKSKLYSNFSRHKSHSKFTTPVT